MAQHTLTLPEILAMLEAAGIGLVQRQRFNTVALTALSKRPTFSEEDDQFEVGSGWGAATFKGHVNFKTGSVEHRLTPGKALEVARMLQEAAEAARSDELLLTLFRTKFGVTEREKLGLILLDVRALRQGTRATRYVDSAPPEEVDRTTLEFGIRQAVAETADTTGLVAGPVSDALVAAVAESLLGLGFGPRAAFRPPVGAEKAP